MEVRTCTKCCEPKPLAEFYERAGRAGGRLSQCKDCIKAVAAARYAADPDHAHRLNRQWVLANPERKRWQRKQWQANNQWKHRSVMAKSNAVYWMKKYGLPVRVEDVDLEELYRRGGGRCGICGELVDVDAAQYDHIIELRDGGTHVEGNLQVAHRACNLKKARRAAVRRRRG